MSKAACRLIAVIGLTCSVAAPACGQVPDVQGWRLVWHDEFDGTALDETKWEPLDRRDSFNNEKQYYHPNQVAVADGNLQLTAIDVPRSGKAYQSGLITSREIFGPGRFEARLDLPTSQGMWPAFWLNANQIPWPQGGEIDIMENRGSQPFLTSSDYHWQTEPGPCCNQHQYVFDEYTASQDGQPVNFHNDFHTYTVEWDDTLLRYYVDGNLHFAVTETPSRPIFETAKNIIVNLAVGGHFGGDPNETTIWPQTMYVDYIRYWQRDTGLSGDYNGDGVVGLADYVVWKDSIGESGIGLAADGTGNGVVNVGDYYLWNANFGASLTQPSTVAIAEPSASSLAVAAATIALAKKTGRRRRAACGHRAFRKTLPLCPPVKLCGPER